MVFLAGIYNSLWKDLLRILGISIFLTTVPFSFALPQCKDTANFFNWFEAQSYQLWHINSPVEVQEVEELSPPQPLFFLSDEEFLNIRFSFDMACLNATDDDFIGFVCGYRDPFTAGSNNYQFLLLDWKARAGTAFSNSAEEGFNLSEFHGNISPLNIPVYFWGHHGLYADGYFTPVVHSYGAGRGWKPDRFYHFDVVYTSGSIKIDLDGIRLFDVNRCNHPGRIGFYTYSQHDVIFRNLTWESSAEAFISPTSICKGDTVSFNLMDTLCGNAYSSVQSWRWNFGDGNSIENVPMVNYIYSQPGSYEASLVAEFPGECFDTVISVINVQAPLMVNLGPDTLLEANSSITLTAGPSQAGYNYLWSNGSVMNKVTIENLDRDSIITVRVRFGKCEAYDTIALKYKTEPPPSDSVIIPNAFHPDGDGLNDLFLPQFKDEVPETYLLKIFNRWGQVVFESTDPLEGWDGKMHGIECPGEVYVYLVKFQMKDSMIDKEPYIKKGNLLLLR